MEDIYVGGTIDPRVLEELERQTQPTVRQELTFEGHDGIFYGTHTEAVASAFKQPEHYFFGAEPRTHEEAAYNMLMERAFEAFPVVGFEFLKK